MGAKCCMPVRDDMPVILRKKYRVPHELYTQRNNRCSPSWSFRCDNRTHIEDIVDNPSWLSHERGDAIVSEFRSAGDTEIEGHSDGSSSSGAFSTPKWQKFPNESNIPGNSQAGAADISTASNTSHEETEITESSSTAIASDPKQSSTAQTDLSSSRVCSKPSDPTSSWKPCPLPGHRFSRQISESRVPTLDSLNEEGSPSFMFSFCSNDLSPGESHCRSSSDGWSIRSFSEFVVSSQRESRTNSQLSSSSFSSDLQTCGLCCKLLKERAPWKGNEISIAAVLVCGHVYHAECLETVTLEASKFDPSCPTCSHGESSAGNALVKAGSRTRNKISRRAVADIDVDGKSMFEHQKNESCMLKDPRVGASSSGKSSFGRSFLRRHLSLGSRSIKSAPEKECPRKKGLWVIRVRGTYLRFGSRLNPLRQITCYSLE